MTNIERRWAKNLTEEEQFQLFLKRSERDRSAAREYARKNKIKNAAKKYNVTEEYLLGLIKSANGICCICNGPLGDKLHIDHDHITNKVRNVLCGSCNNGLGQFKDSIENLRRALRYLEHHRQID